MANDFSDAIAVWRFEPGALTTDSQGGVDLTNNNVVAENTTNHFEGSGCADLEKSSAQYFSLANAALTAGFPFKAGDTVKQMSFCCYFRPEGVSGGNYLLSVSDSSVGKRSFGITLDAGTISVLNGYGVDGVDYQLARHQTPIAALNRYFICITHDGVAKTSFIRLYDSDTKTKLGTDKYTTWLGETNVDNADLNIGSINDGSATFCFDGLFDQMVVWNKLLTPDDFDDVINGIYGSNLPIEFTTHIDIQTLTDSINTQSIAQFSTPCNITTLTTSLSISNKRRFSLNITISTLTSSLVINTTKEFTSSIYIISLTSNILEYNNNRQFKTDIQLNTLTNDIITRNNNRFVSSIDITTLTSNIEAVIGLLFQTNIDGKIVTPEIKVNNIRKLKTDILIPTITSIIDVPVTTDLYTNIAIISTTDDIILELFSINNLIPNILISVNIPTVFENANFKTDFTNA